MSDLQDALDSLDWDGVSPIYGRSLDEFTLWKPIIDAARRVANLDIDAAKKAFDDTGLIEFAVSDALGGYLPALGVTND